MYRELVTNILNSSFRHFSFFFGNFAKHRFFFFSFLFPHLLFETKRNGKENDLVCTLSVINLSKCVYVCIYMCMLCVCVCVLHDACNTMTLYIFSGEGKKVSTESNPAKILEWNHHPKAQSSWTWWNADVRALSPISLYYTLRGSLCFEAFADEHTFVRSDPLSLGIPWWDPAKFLFYFLSGTFNFSVTFFFFLSCWPNLYYYPVWWDDRRLCRVDRLNFAAGRKISGNIGRDRENGSESGKFGRDRTRYRDLARARPNFSESLWI